MERKEEKEMEEGIRQGEAIGGKLKETDGRERDEEEKGDKEEGRN